MSEYDLIAESYKESRKFSLSIPEVYSYFNLIGNLTGKTVLELGCGEGFYTRKFKSVGAKRVVGIDISERMVELAVKEEMQLPLGIEYMIKDVMELDKIDDFDLVTVTFLLNHAQTREQLLKMCLAISTNLKSNGRFVIINNNLELSPLLYDLYEKYGRRQCIDKPYTLPLKEGTPITVTLFHGDNKSTFVDYYLSKDSYDWALENAGLKEVCWHLPTVAPKELKEFGQNFWQDFIDYPSFIMIDGIKE